jgi:hypothetical protein
LLEVKSLPPPGCEFALTGYAEIHIQRPFFDNKKDIYKILGLKIQTVKTSFSASSIPTSFYFRKKLKSRFLVVFQSFFVGQIFPNSYNSG